MRSAATPQILNKPTDITDVAADRIWTGLHYLPTQDLGTQNGAVAVDTSTGVIKKKIVLDADITALTLTGGTEGQELVLYLYTDSVNDRSVTPSGINGTAPATQTGTDVTVPLVWHLDYTSSGWQFAT